MEALPKHVEVVNAFLRVGDVLAAKALAQEHYDVLAAPESASYLGKLKSAYRDDPRALEVLDDCIQLLSRCRETNVHVAFAEWFRRLKPLPISEAAVAALAPVWGSLELVKQLAESRPELLAEISQAMVGGALVADLLAAPHQASRFATVQTRVLLLRAVLLLIDRRLDAKVWADAMLLLADTLLEHRSVDPTISGVDEARSVLGALFDEVSTNPHFAPLREEFLSKSIQRLNRLDGEGIEQPSYPADFVTRPRHGTAIFLRPLLGSAVPRLANRFRNPERLAIRFHEEPAVISLDAALHRVLAYHVTFLTIGGRPEGVGSPRFFTPGGSGWQDIARFILEEAHAIFLYPADSEGVRWEIETISSLGMLAKVLIIVPPNCLMPVVSDAWKGAARVLRESGILLPQATEEGLLCRLDARGGVVQVTSFHTIWNDELYEWIKPLLPPKTIRSAGSPYGPVSG